MASKSKSLKLRNTQKIAKEIRTARAEAVVFMTNPWRRMAQRLKLKIPKYCTFCQVTYRLTVERRSARQAKVTKAKFTRKELGDLVQKRFGSKPR